VTVAPRQRQRQRQILLALDHDRNRELLEAWVDGDATLAAATDEGAFDVVVFDGPAFARRRAWLRRTREEQQPVYVPSLLMTPHREVSLLTDELWRDVDDLITTPIRPGELRVRLERLLHLREQSLQTARSNSDLQQFAFVAAHELSTPLTVVIGVLETVLTRYPDGLEPDVANLLGAARSSSGRLQHLIDDLLAYSRAGRETALVPVDLRVALDEALAQLETQIALSGAEVVADELPVVLGNAQQLRLVFANLVGNAIKYRRAGQRPLVQIGSAPRDDDVWYLSVEDNGIGIEPERAEAVFAMFERNQPDGDRPGSGIGLALCKRILERHGGEIWVEQAATGGTVVKFSLQAAV
jgi:signal transduction histidine kinase